MITKQKASLVADHLFWHVICGWQKVHIFRQKTAVLVPLDFTSSDDVLMITTLRQHLLHFGTVINDHHHHASNESLLWQNGKQVHRQNSDRERRQC